MKRHLSIRVYGSWKRFDETLLPDKEDFYKM